MAVSFIADYLQWTSLGCKAEAEATVWTRVGHFALTIFGNRIDVARAGLCLCGVRSLRNRIRAPEAVVAGAPRFQ